MKKLVTRLYVNRSVEEIIFSFILIAGIPYFVLNEIIDLLTNRSLVIGIINSVLIFSIIYLLKLSVKGTLTKTHIFIFCLMLSIGFALFWPASTGLSGAGAYVLQSLIVVLLIVNTGKSRAFFAIFLLIMVLVAGFADIEYAGKIVYRSQLISFIINTIAIALVMNIFKIYLDRERKKLVFKITKLDQINKEIEHQNQVLESNQEEIKRIQTNLQQIIKERTREIEAGNKRLVEYAFINAHLVRAPLANLMGLSELMNSDDPDLMELQKKMEVLDTTIRKIGGILSIDDSERVA